MANNATPAAVGILILPHYYHHNFYGKAAPLNTAPTKVRTRSNEGPRHAPFVFAFVQTLLAARASRWDT